MSQSVVLKGSEIKVYISGKIYPEAKSISYTIDYGEDAIYGIDSPYPQEIATTRISVQGSISGVRVKYSGGLQAHEARAKINQILYASYTSLRIKDRYSDVDILWLPQMKVTSETFQVQAKGIATLSFTFKGIIPYNEIDLNG